MQFNIRLVTKLITKEAYVAYSYRGTDILCVVILMLLYSLSLIHVITQAPPSSLPFLDPALLDAELCSWCRSVRKCLGSEVLKKTHRP